MKYDITTYGCLGTNDVDESLVSSASSSRGRKGMARHSRREGTRGATLRLTHRPTGIVVEGSIPEGNYSRKEMVALRESLRRELWPRLESAVARALRVRGR